ncbi:MAG: phosphoglycerate mutase (2,3-diphosphoglycerate-independent) [Alphaproteobacteria bacterium RIFOXYD12_FULL_60_8]|nr:MAG: phosphoglycerate mutase (2,3-diphosphoglycerate-independent) [Alphaproteobacteria bacterium RIFOXYD12_FULL_60_8]
MIRPKPVVLCILDGWGYRKEKQDNAIALARIPTWERMLASYPHTLIETSGLNVGLPEGQMGNSEVGHMNLGAGRVVMQDLPRIGLAVKDGSIGNLPALRKMIDTLRQSGGVCHLLGLLSPGGVHAHMDHMLVLAKKVAEAGVPVAIHAFLDGRDTPPSSGRDYVEQFAARLKSISGQVSLASLSGRYYAMDRDQRWDRVSLAYQALRSGQGPVFDDPVAAVEASYAKDIHDEFVLPTVARGYSGMRDGDGLLMANFRADRAREILAALADPKFSGFDRGPLVAFAARLGMVEYSTQHNAYMDVLFPQIPLTNLFGEVVSEAGLSQLRIAETEKYAHVTYFFNGGEERPNKNERHILIQSPQVATYDLQPEMSAPEVTDRLIAAIESEAYDVIVVNYANGDMVGHTGVLKAAIQAVETLDSCLARLEEAVAEAGGTMLVTADHGNCEMMRDPVTGEPHTAHTIGAVPLVLVNPPHGVERLEAGRLADVAPTLLHLLDLEQPAEMTGQSLLVETRRRATA